MKRLLAAGYEKIFQICPCFRAGERGDRHLPEMTLLEWYTAHADYRAMMGQCEQLIKHVVNFVNAVKKKQIESQDQVKHSNLPPISSFPPNISIFINAPSQNDVYHVPL